MTTLIVVGNKTNEYQDKETFISLLYPFKRHETYIFTLLFPRQDNSRVIKCYPCPSVRPSLRTSVSTSHQRRPLSKLNSFDRNFMNFGHIVKFLMSSSSSIGVHIAPCLQELLPFVNDNTQLFMVSSLFYEVWSR